MSRERIILQQSTSLRSADWLSMYHTPLSLLQIDGCSRGCTMGLLHHYNSLELGSPGFTYLSRYK